MELADLMNTNVLSVPPDTTLAEVAHRMVDHDTGAACVIDGDQLAPDLIEGVHEAFPQAAIFARAYDRRALIKLKGSPVKASLSTSSASLVSETRRATGRPKPRNSCGA